MIDFHEADDAAWGKHMREACQDLTSGKTERGVAADMAAAQILMAACMELNATEVTFTMTGATWRGDAVGDWEVVMRQVKKP